MYDGNKRNQFLQIHYPLLKQRSNIFTLNMETFTRKTRTRQEGSLERRNIIVCCFVSVKFLLCKRLAERCLAFLSQKVEVVRDAIGKTNDKILINYG